MATGPGTGPLTRSSRFAAAVDELRGSRAFSVQASLWLLPVSVYFAVVSYTLTGTASWQVALIAGVVGWLALGAALLTAKTLLFPQPGSRHSLGLVIACYAVAAALRTVAVSVTVAASIGFALTPAFILQRLAASVPQLTAAAVAAALVTASISDQRDRWRLAAAARAQRSAIQQESQRRMRADVEDFATLITERLLPLIDRVEAQFGEGQQEARALAAEVREMCQVEVREVSHQLAVEPKPIRLSESLPERPTLLWALSRSFDDTRFYAGWAYLAVALLAVPMATVRAGWGGVGWMLAVLTLSAAIAMASAAVPLPKAIASGRPLLLLQLIWVLALAWFTQWLLRQTPYFGALNGALPPSVWLYLSLAVFVWLGLNFVGGSLRAAEAAIADLNADNLALAREVSRLRRAHSKVRQRQAQLLHGPVQGRLSAVSMALTMHAQEPGVGWVEQAREQLHSARAALQEALGRDIDSAADGQPRTLAARLGAVAGEWRGLMDVMVSVDPDCESACDAEPEVADEIADAVEECLVNSVRHGHARRASVFVGCDFDVDGQVLAVEVTDDGQAAEATPSQAGLGGRILAAGGASREIIRTTTGTRVRIEWRRDSTRPVGR